MWLLLLIITARAIIGSPDAETMDSVQQKFGDANSEILPVVSWLYLPTNKRVRHLYLIYFIWYFNKKDNFL